MSSGGFWSWTARAWGRMHLAYEILLPCRFAILVLVVVAVMLAAADQGLESLRVMAEFAAAGEAGAREPFLLRLFLFAMSAFALAGAAWYFSRQALLLEPPRGPESREADVIFRWAPRVLGVLSFALPAVALWIAADQYSVDRALQQVPSPRLLLRLLSVLFLGCGLGFGVFLIKRRALLRLEALTRPRRRRRVVELPRATRAVLWGSSILTLALFVGIIVDPIGLTAYVATPTVVLFCAAIWVFVGTVLLIVAARIRLPLFTFLAVALLLASRTNDNHRVRAAGPARVRPDLARAADQWLTWMDEHYPDEQRHPLFIVAAEGGGLRAAYWTAAVLSAIHTQFLTFSDHCFAVSAVSGGSLGAAVFDSLLASEPDAFRQSASRVLSRDFLAPTTARMLGTDLPQQFLPWPLLPDRGAALSQAWERAWKNAWKESPSDVFSRPFLELASVHRPLLFLNGTEVETGKRVIFSPVQIEPSLPNGRGTDVFKNAVDGIDLVGGDLPTSGAVLMSARFTYISPAGMIRVRKALPDGRTERSTHRVVDGGYFENSGAATAAEILEFLGSEANPRRARVSPHVIFITHSEKPLPNSRFLNEELSPLRALFATRVARGDHAVAELRAAAGDAWTEFTLATDQGVPLPLGWLLSAQARRAIDAAVDSGLNQTARAQIGSLLTNLPLSAARNNHPDPLSDALAKEKRPSRGIGSAIHQIVKGR